MSNFRNTRRKRRSGHKNRKTIIITAAALAIVLAAGFALYGHLPFVKVNKAIAAGNRFSEEEDYEAAIDSYSKAIEIDKKAVAAYSNMAGAYLSIEDCESAKQVLYDGWQNTDNTGLLDNYHRVIMNEAVDAMNTHTSDLSDVSDVVSILSDNSGNEDAIKLLDEAYLRVFDDAYGYSPNALFRKDAVSEDEKGDNVTYSFDEYNRLVSSMIAAYEIGQSADLADVILKYATPGMASFTMNTEDIPKYDNLLSQVQAKVGDTDEISSMRACLGNAVTVSDTFADIFTQLDVGNVDELRDFVVSDKYLQLRDIFLNNMDTPQENTTYVPISREAVIFDKNEEKWTYRFLDFEENPDTKGVITLWANFFEDDGVQRNAISYEPASIEGQLYPHTKYTVTYLLSYTTKGKSTKVAKMNYRLETEITDESGETARTIVGDWGGPDEWVMDLDKIESRIRA